MNLEDLNNEGFVQVQVAGESCRLGESPMTRANFAAALKSLLISKGIEVYRLSFEGDDVNTLSDLPDEITSEDEIIVGRDVVGK